MHNARYLLSRLNAPGMRYTPRSDGRPELTASDIAHALGFITDTLGAEVLLACWWPDGAVSRRERLQAAVIALVKPEIKKQHDQITDARLDSGIVEACMRVTRTVTAAQRAARARAESRLKTLKETAWPQKTLETLPALVTAVVHEIAQPRDCPACHGRGKVRNGVLMRTCTVCGGSGTVPISDRKRAAALGRDVSTYCKKWRGVYEWLLDTLRAAEQRAAAELKAALREDAA